MPGMDGRGPGRGGGRGGPSQRGGGFFGGRGGMGRGGAPSGPVPPNYLCRRCSQPGHFIQDCPTNGEGARGRDVRSLPLYGFVACLQVSCLSLLRVVFGWAR